MASGQSQDLAVEDAEFQKALEASMKDSIPPDSSTDAKTESTDDGKSEVQSQKPESPPPRYTIKDCIRHIDRTLPKIRDNAGDTYIFIDPPPRQPEQSTGEYRTYCRRYANPIMMKSEKLVQASPLFKEMLGPSQQFRTIRRRGLVGQLPFSVRYVLDLTPPIEGDDAVYLTASLCCPEGVRFWHQASEIWKVSNQLVGGAEEWSSSSGNGGSTSEATAIEYSPIHHRSAIERVLAAIQGFDIRFDSAIKVWSTAVVAEYYGITCHTCTYLADCLVTWLRVEPNCNFVEVNPEITLRIAAGVQNEALVRDSFAILVGEEALDLLVRNRLGAGKSCYTVFGRKKEGLPESWLERIEYASKSLIERHLKDVENLLASDLLWIDEQQEIQHIRTFEDSSVKAIAANLISTLKNVVQSEVYAVLFEDFHTSLVSNTRKQPHWRLTPHDFHNVPYHTLSPLERVFSRPFWSKLRANFDFVPGLHTREQLIRGGISRFPQDPLSQKYKPMTFPSPTMKDLIDLIAEGQTRMDEVQGAKFSRIPPLLSDMEVLSQPLNGTPTPSTIWGQHMLPYRPFQNMPTDLSHRQDGYVQPTPDHSARIRPPRAESVGWQQPQLDDTYKFFDLNAFFSLADSYLSGVADQKLAPADLPTRRDPHQPAISQTLTCLAENEWKYLPLWAGGLDDETGAIYADDVMEAPPGVDFSTAGPSVHMGNSTYTSSSANSDYDMMSDVGSSSSSFNTSTAVADGHTDQLFRGKIYTPRSTASSATSDGALDLPDFAAENKAKQIIPSLQHGQSIGVETTSLDHALQLRPKTDIPHNSLFRGCPATDVRSTSDTSYDDLYHDDSDGEIDQGLAEDGYDSDVTEREDGFQDDFENLGKDSQVDEGGVLV